MARLAGASGGRLAARVVPFRLAELGDVAREAEASYDLGPAAAAPGPAGPAAAAVGGPRGAPPPPGLLEALRGAVRGRGGGGAPGALAPGARGEGPGGSPAPGTGPPPGGEWSPAPVFAGRPAACVLCYPRAVAWRHLPGEGPGPRAGDGGWGGGGAGDAGGGGAGPPAGFEAGTVVVVLASSESVAMGVWVRGRLTDHKVLRGYTVRKKQGRSQLSHLRGGGGGGSAGGRLRAREAARLFGGAAAWLHGRRAAAGRAEALVWSGGVRVWNELYAAGERRGTPVPVARGDVRWCRAGEGVARPRHEDVVRVWEAAQRGAVVYVDDVG